MKAKHLFLLIMISMAFTSLYAETPSEEGKAIFTARCASCHNVNKILTGPALAGVDQRRTIDWIISFVHSSQTMIRKGDQTALALFEKFNRVPMPDHPDLTENHIKSIVEYIKTEAVTVNTTNQPPFVRPAKKMINYIPLSIQKDYGLFLGYFAAVVLLIMALLFVVRFDDFKRKMVNDQRDSV